MNTSKSKRKESAEAAQLRISRGGPSFFLNPYLDDTFTRCPKCGGPTKARKVPLVIRVEEGELMVWNGSCRLCPSCNLLIAQRWAVEGGIAEAYERLYDDFTEEDYLVLGTLTREQWQKSKKAKVSSEEMFTQTQLFEEVYDFVLPDDGSEYQINLKPKRAASESTATARGRKERSPGKGKTKAAAAKSSDIYELRITLRNSDPPIWRRVAVPAGLTLAGLHDVIQAVMGWDDDHLHQFTDKNQTCYASSFVLQGDFSEGFDEEQVGVSQVLNRRGAKLLYEYDFGDSWEHEVKVEKIRPAEAGAKVPICLAGEQACPPDDCGGLWGYYNLLDTLADPKHKEHEEMLEWTGGKIDPEAFDLAAANKRLRSAFGSRR